MNIELILGIGLLVSVAINIVLLIEYSHHKEMAQWFKGQANSQRRAARRANEKHTRLTEVLQLVIDTDKTLS